MNPEEIEKLDGIGLMSLVYGNRRLSMWLSGEQFETTIGKDSNMDENTGNFLKMELRAY